MAYPIIDDRHRGSTRRRDLSRPGGRHRDQTAPPHPAAHHVLVYRVGGRYVEGGAGCRPDADQLAVATQVTTVDIRREAVTVVRLAVPAADVGTFTVRVTFRCTVVDPVMVVREGITDARAILAAYLRNHRQIFALGRRHPLSAAGQLNGSVRAQIGAYVALMPPTVDGMVIALSDVDVSAPADLTDPKPRVPGHAMKAIDADPRRTLVLALSVDRSPPTPAAGRCTHEDRRRALNAKLEMAQKLIRRGVADVQLSTLDRIVGEFIDAADRLHSGGPAVAPSVGATAVPDRVWESPRPGTT